MFGTESHNLTSPGFPGDYPSQLRCQWQIRAVNKPSQGSADSSPRRLLASIVAFQLENQYDYLTLYNQDVESRATDLITKLTGSIRLTTIVSSGPILFIKFTSDNTGSRMGIKIHFQPIDRTSKKHRVVPRLQQKRTPNK